MGRDGECLGGLGGRDKQDQNILCERKRKTCGDNHDVSQPHTCKCMVRYVQSMHKLQVDSPPEGIREELLSFLTPLLPLPLFLVHSFTLLQTVDCF
jgi:hypothetical protein